MLKVLELKNLYYKYNKQFVLKDVSFEIENASFFTLLGLNGAGKSTIFALITRLLSLQSGNIKINNFDIKDYKKALKNIGIVFQEPTLDLDLNVKQNLYFYGSLQGLSFSQTMASIETEIDKIGLGNKLYTTVRDLNGGHRRRVEILRALINSPKILLLDEPTVGLDIKSRFEIIEYIRDIVKQRDISVLWITHLFDEIKEDDKAAIIKNGEIVESGVVKNIIKKHDKDSLSEVFNYLNKVN